MRILLALILLALPALTPAQGYIPVQPTHWGNWYNPAQSGEGLELSVIDDGNPDGVLLFGNAFLLICDAPVLCSPYWASLQGRAATAWDGSRYELVLFQRPAPSSPPESIGSIWLRPNLFGQLHWTVLASEPLILREGWLTQLTRPVPGVIGVCGMVGFPPFPPQANPRFCHD